ncbi:MAG: glycosyltransferase family 4 protein [Acidobacteriota bacterium]|jgi:glycosyltransferase involved in cell wall biosynthesis
MGHRLAVTARFFGHVLRDVLGTLRARLARWYRRVVEGQDVLVVGVDIFPFFEKMTGVGWYEWNLLSHLQEVDPGLELNLYAHAFAAPDEPSPPPLPVAGPRARFRFHHLPAGFLLPVGPTIRALRATLEPLLMFLDGNDVYFAPNFFVPRRHWPAVRRLVATVHDLAFVRLPETVQQETLDNLRRHLPAALFAADALIAVSQATAEDLAELEGVAVRRIHVIHEGVDATFLDGTPPAPPAGLPPRYLLFVSTLEPRKNIVGVLRGFAAAAAAGYPGALVLVGRWGWRTEAARAELASSPVRERILHLDYVARGQLRAVLAGAEALLFPSLLEGFGLPVVESMACGVPAIVSRISSLPEVAGEAGVYVDPGDPQDIARAILRLGEDEGERRRLAALGRARAAQFSWRRAAEATVTVFRRVAGLPCRYADAYRV